MRNSRTTVAAAVVAALAGWSFGQESPAAAPATQAAKVISLAESAEAFAAQFNADSQELRFLAVLSPS